MASSRRVPGRIINGGSSRRAWDGGGGGQPLQSTLLQGGFEIALSGIRIGSFSNPGSGDGGLRLRYRPEAECISFEGPNSRGMLVPLEEMLLHDNQDGTLSIFFRRQFRRKYYILEGSPPGVCEYIQAYKNELGTELHMLCYITGRDPLSSSANFVRRVKQGRSTIPLTHRTTDFPSLSTYRHPQPRISIPPTTHNLDDLLHSHPDGPRVHFQNRPPPPVPQPPRSALRGGSSQFREYDYDGPPARDPRSSWSPLAGEDGDDEYPYPRPRSRNRRNSSADRSEPHLRPSRSRGSLDGEWNGEPERFQSPPPRSRSTIYGDLPGNGMFEPPPPPPRMFALVYRKSPTDSGVEIRPAGIASSYEALVRQARECWGLREREVRLFGHVDGLKMVLRTQVDLEAYVKLCEGIQRLMIDVE